MNIENLHILKKNLDYLKNFIHSIEIIFCFSFFNIVLRIIHHVASIAINFWVFSVPIELMQIHNYKIRTTNIFIL